MHGFQGAHDEIWSMSRRYASYWNAFLFSFRLTCINTKLIGSARKAKIFDQGTFVGILSVTCRYFRRGGPTL